MGAVGALIPDWVRLILSVTRDIIEDRYCSFIPPESQRCCEDNILYMKGLEQASGTIADCPVRFSLRPTITTEWTLKCEAPKGHGAVSKAAPPESHTSREREILTGPSTGLGERLCCLLGLDSHPDLASDGKGFHPGISRNIVHLCSGLKELSTGAPAETEDLLLALAEA